MGARSTVRVLSVKKRGPYETRVRCPPPGDPLDVDSLKSVTVTNLVRRSDRPRYARRVSLYLFPKGLVYNDDLRSFKGSDGSRRPRVDPCSRSEVDVCVGPEVRGTSIGLHVSDCLFSDERSTGDGSHSTGQVFTAQTVDDFRGRGTTTEYRGRTYPLSDRNFRFLCRNFS